MRVKLDMSTKGQREILRNYLSDNNAGQTRRKAKSHNDREPWP